MSQAAKLWNHFRAGTLRHRLQGKKRAAQWNRLASATTTPIGAYEDVELLSGALLRIYAGNELGKLICTSLFELAEQVFLKRFLRRGDTFVDVGANVGLFTVSASRYVGPTGKVLAFEPVRATHVRLQENIQLNSCKNVHAFNFALSDTATKLPINTSAEGLDAWSSLVQPSTPGNFATETIDAVTYDQFSQSNPAIFTPSPALMKIDVEGWEQHVLEGAQSALSKTDAPTLLVEFNDENARAGGWSCAQMYRRLIDLHYHAFLYSIEHGLQPENLREKYLWENLIFTKSPNELFARVKR